MTVVPQKVRKLLADTYTPEGIDIWWEACNKNLADTSPKAVWTWGTNGKLDVFDEINRITGGH